MSARRCLVTGATGFVGANLTRRLLSEGLEVQLLVRPGHQSWRIQGLLPHVQLLVAELSDADSVKAAIQIGRPEWIFHCAAFGAYSSQSDVTQMITTNIQGTVNLVEAASTAGFEAFVYAGSSSEYGFKDHAPREDECPEPNSAYAITKLAATHFLQHAAIAKQLPVVTLRLYSVFGPFEEPTRLIPNLLLSSLEGRLPPLANPGIARDYVYCEDVSDAMLSAARFQGHRPGAVYNLGTGVQTSLAELVDLVGGLLPVRQQPQWGSMPDRVWDTATWVADGRKIQESLGWSPRYSLEAGLRAFIAWFREHAALLQYYRERVRILPKPAQTS